MRRKSQEDAQKQARVRKHILFRRERASVNTAMGSGEKTQSKNRKAFTNTSMLERERINKERAARKR